MDDSLKWIQDVLAVRLSEYENWILVNDIDPRSKKEGREIQNYLFNLGYSWSRYRSGKELKDFCIYGIYHYVNNPKTMYYHDGCREAEIKITNKDIESGEWKVYYWSQINPVVMKEESGELDWIKDIEAGDLWTPYVGMKFIVTDGSDDVIYHILNINDEEGWMELKWKDNKSGEEEYFGWYMEDYYRMVEEDRIQIVHDKLNESEKDLDWIKNINPIPLLEVGSCFVDVMDPTQREWTIVSLPMVGESRTKFVRLFTIDEEGEGVYEMIRKDKFQEDVYTGRYKPCQR